MFFIAIETFCFWLIVENNVYQGASFFNTSNYYAGRVLETRSGVVDYFRLADANSVLAEENAALKKMLLQEKQKSSFASHDTIDFLRQNQYSFIPAKVINNSFRFNNNYITLNKGLKDGIRPKMGVITSSGVVGRVKSCSENFSTVVSLLYTGMKISTKVKHKNIECSVEWDGVDPTKANLLYVVRHHKVAVGDTIVTSENNAIYPEGVMVGTISEVKLDQGRSDYDIDINLSTDFTRLSYVYVVENALKHERDSLELFTQPKDGK